MRLSRAGEKLGRDINGCRAHLERDRSIRHDGHGAEGAELSRPRDLKVQVKGKKGEVAPPPVAPLDVAALQGTVPAGTSIIPVGQGDVREITLADGTKKKIRILRAPGTAAITSSTPE
jgi:hypothetical protein